MLWTCCLLAAGALLGCDDKPKNMKTPAPESTDGKAPVASFGGANPQGKKKTPSIPPPPAPP
jgi:hypothetical protein